MEAGAEGVSTGVMVVIAGTDSSHRVRSSSKRAWKVERSCRRVVLRVSMLFSADVRRERKVAISSFAEVRSDSTSFRRDLVDSRSPSRLLYLMFWRH